MRRRATFTALMVVVVVTVAAGVAEDAADVAADVTPSLHAAVTPPPPTLTLPDAAYWTGDIDGDDGEATEDASDDDVADVGSEDEVTLETAVDAEAADAATSEATTTSTFTPITTFGTVPDADGIPSSTYRGVDLAVDGDAVFVAVQDGGRNWHASVFRVDGGGAPKPVGGSPGFTPGPAMDLTLALAPSGTPSSPRLAVAYREGVYHHGYYRDGDDSWVYVAGSPASRFAQVGAAFTNARPRDLALAFSPSNSPIVAYSDDEYERRATVRALDKAGGWPTLGEQGLSRGRVSGLQLASDPAGDVYVAYADASCNDRATVMKLTSGANWTSVGPPCLSVGKAAGLSLTLVPGNNASSPCISYGDGGAGGIGVVGCFADGGWRVIGAQPFSATRTAATSLTFDPTRHSLLVSYRDGGYGGRLSVSQANAGGWSVLARRGFSQDAVWRTRVGVTAKGKVWVAGEIGSGGDETDGVVVYKM